MKIIIISLSLFYVCTCAFGQTENFWTRKADYGSDTIGNGIKIERNVSFTIGDIAYVGTGVDTAEQVHNDFWKYDVTTDEWTPIASLPGVPRRNAVAFSINGYGYVGTGYDAPSVIFGVTSALTDFYRYDPVANSWSPIANFPGGIGNGVYFSTAFATDTKGYVCGGKFGPNNYTNQLWEYDPVLNQWGLRAPFPGGVRYQMSSFVVDNKAYVGLGTDQDMYRKDIWEYKPATNQWISKSDFPASARSTAMTFTIGQRGYVCMGNNGGVLDDLWEYNPFTDQWSIRDTYGGSPRKGGFGFSVLGRGYVGTGKGVSGKKSSVHEYTPYNFVSLNELANDMNVYPNPFSSTVHIETDSKEIETVEIYSSIGALVFSSDFTAEINVQQLDAGVYFLMGIDMEGNIIAQHKLLKN